MPVETSYSREKSSHLVADNGFGTYFWASSLQGAAERLMARISSLEAQVLEGRAVLATAEADRGGIVSELSAAKDAVGCMEEVKAEMAAASAREEALRVEIAAQNNALKV